MTVRIDLLRPDDLLNLHIEGDNLRLDVGERSGPALVLDDPGRPGFLIVTFPPQTVVEGAVYESSPTPPTPPSDASHPVNAVHPPESQPVLPMRSRIGRSSRLVFRIPAGSRQSIPYNTAGLLDWSRLELNVSALADVPASPSAAQRHAAPSIAEPGRLDTAVELPYRLILSPNHAVTWTHARGLKTRQGMTELWHTRMGLKAADGSVGEISHTHPAPLRAIWSPDYNSARFNSGDPPRFGELDPDWGVLTPMTPSDRHEIVALTSGFSGYVKDLDDFTDYEPKPVDAEQFMLSPLGGWLKCRGEWDPPATFRPFIFRPDRGLEEWRNHLARIPELRPLPDAEAERDEQPLAAAAELAPGLIARGGAALWPFVRGTTG